MLLLQAETEKQAVNTGHGGRGRYAESAQPLNDAETRQGSELYILFYSIQADLSVF